MQTILVTNFKGGSGKSTTALNLAGCLSSRGFNVALADLDLEQGTLRDWAAIKDQPPVDVYTVEPAKIFKFLSSVKDEYDYVVMDSPPRSNAETDRILAASQMALVPLNPSMADFNATKHKLDEIKKRVDLNIAKHGENNAMPRTALVLSQVRKGEAVNRRIREAIASDPGVIYPLLSTEISRYQVYRYVMESGETVHSQERYTPSGHKGAVNQLESMTDEVLEVLNGGH